MQLSSFHQSVCLKFYSFKILNMTSKKTFWAGLLAMITLASTQAGYMFDADPLTNPDWGVVANAFFVGLIGLFARDNNVTSEQANAKK